MAKGKDNQKKYATAGNPTVNAVLKSLFRFESEKQAIEKLEQLKRNFVTSKQSESANSAIIWVRGYALTEEEKKQGYTGNFAFVSCRPEGNRFTLQATKLESELKFHPQRKRPKRKHPDWGHPILRGIKKKHVFDTIEEAGHELMRLHEEFPDVSIPDENRLLIIVYEKSKESDSPVQKYKFEVQAVPEGGFIIAYKQNNRPVKSKMPGGKPVESKGYFTSMVSLKRKRKPGNKN